MKTKQPLFCTLKKRQDFLKISNGGKRYYSEHFLVQILQNPENSGMFRVGYVATRKIGNAVNRNKAKRRLRSLVYLNQHQIPLGYEYVFVAKASLWSVTFEILQNDFVSLFTKITHAVRTPHQSVVVGDDSSVSNDG